MLVEQPNNTLKSFKKDTDFDIVHNNKDFRESRGILTLDSSDLHIRTEAFTFKEKGDEHVCKAVIIDRDADGIFQNIKIDQGDRVTRTKNGKVLIILTDLNPHQRIYSWINDKYYVFNLKIVK